MPNPLDKEQKIANAIEDMEKRVSGRIAETAGTWCYCADLGHITNQKYRIDDYSFFLMSARAIGTMVQKKT